jgi:hypothetical protein
MEIHETGSALLFRAKIVPGSSKTAIAGEFDGMLKVKVSAPPEKGKANAALLDCLGKILGVKRNNITITSGQTNPVKTISVEGINKHELLEKLNTKG